VQPRPVEATLIELVRARLAEAAQDIGRAESLLDKGNVVDARRALQAARQSQEDARVGLRAIETLPTRLQGYLSVTRDLSIVKVRAVDARPSFPVEVPEELRADLRAAGKEQDAQAFVGMVRLLGDVFAPEYRLFQDIDAEILEAHTVGKRYASQTVRGRQFPAQKRADLPAGGTIELHSSPPTTGVGTLQEGQDYWVAITPPIAAKAIPREIGALGRTWIVFAMPAGAHR
jgi:hypothetical protein